MNRRLFMFSSAAVLLGSTTGCLTPALYDKIDEPEYREYTETVNQILFSADGKKLVFIGPKYHYIFDAPEHLAALLNSPLHKKLSATLDGFSVDLDAKVTGEIDLKIENPDDSERSQALALGFSGSGNDHSLQCTLYPQGIRYSAKGFTMPASITHLDQSYTIKVKEYLPTGAKKALVLLTPLTVAADGVILLFSMPLLVCWFSFGHPNVLF